LELAEAQSRAEQARRLLSDPVLSSTYAECHSALVGAVKQSKTPEEAFKAAIALQVFDLIKNALQSHIETAKVMEFNFREPQKKRFGMF
jgi:predicted RNase H-like HicB family nuclease